MDVLVGLDSGTTATKAVTAGADARVRDVASVGYPLRVPRPGWAELDARRLQGAAIEALADVVARARGRGDTVVGLCLSAAMHGVAPMAADGSPLGPLVTWADGRAAEQAAALVADARAPALHARTGTPVHPMSPLMKLVCLTGCGEDDVERDGAAAVNRRVEVRAESDYVAQAQD